MGVEFSSALAELGLPLLKPAGPERSSAHPRPSSAHSRPSSAPPSPQPRPPSPPAPGPAPSLAPPPLTRLLDVSPAGGPAGGAVHEAVRGAGQADGAHGGAQLGGRGQAQQGQVGAQFHAAVVIRHQDGGHCADVRAVRGPVLGVHAQQHRPLGRGLQGPVPAPGPGRAGLGRAGAGRGPRGRGQSRGGVPRNPGSGGAWGAPNLEV